MSFCRSGIWSVPWRRFRLALHVCPRGAGGTSGPCCSPTPPIWIENINTTQQATVNFLIIADADRKVSELHDLIHPNASATATVRSLFIIDPARKIRLVVTYPASTGRNFDEILRVIDSLQLTDSHSVATPGNWKHGEDVVIVPSLQDPEIIRQKFLKGYTAIRPYLRITPQPNPN
jgi:thioredoxin-dependent peroxiredoxin